MKIFRSFWKLEVAVGSIGLIATALVLYSLFLTSVIREQHVPLIHMVKNLKFKVTSAHLWFEEAVNGDRSIDIQRDVYTNIDHALALCNLILANGENGTPHPFKALQDTTLTIHFTALRKQISSFRELTEARWNNPESNKAGSPLDQSYDATFNEIMQLSNETEKAVDQYILKDHTTLTQITVALTTLLASLFSGLVILVLRNRRSLEAKNTVLEVKAGELSREIAERKKAEEALRENQRMISTLMSNLPGMAYRCRNDEDWTVEFASEGCWELTGYQTSDLMENRVSYGRNLIHPEDRESVWKQVQEALQIKAPFRLIYRIRTALGKEKWVWEQGRGIFSEQGILQALEGFIADITERKEAEKEISILAQFPEKNPNPILRAARDATILYANSPSLPLMEAWGCRVGGLLPEIWHPLIAKALETGSSQDFELPVENRIFGFSLVPLEEHKCVYLYAQDITERKRAEGILTEQAVRDTLTDLYNRRYFGQRITEEIARAERNGKCLAILLCDLDHFKAINDNQGHQTGDEVLKTVAIHIQEATRGTDLVFRWGGDEVVVVLSETSHEGVRVAGERIRKSILKVRKTIPANVDVSIGIALYPYHGSNADELIRIADLALYIAKKGGDKIHIGTEEYQLDRHSDKVALQPLIEVQPIVDIQSQQVIGYEAFGRDPQGKLSISELFKKYQVIGKLEELKRICFQTQIKAAQEGRLKRLFLNVDFNILSQVEPPQKPSGTEIILEISELESLQNIENRLAVIEKWREHGYEFAVDDFGAGNLFLPFMARLAPEYIKIDRSVILQASCSEPFKALIKGFIATLKDYAKKGIIAEGIETTKELAIVKDLEISFVQGYLTGKPKLFY